MGIKFVNRSSIHSHTHTHKVPHTHSSATRCHNTSFSAVSIKPHWQEPCPLLSNRHAEMFTFTYKWPGVMLCHIMFHGQIMCPISQSALQPLSPLRASIVTATPRHHGCKKGTLYHHSEVPLWIKSQGYRGKLNQHCGSECFGGKRWQTHEHQRRVVITLFQCRFLRLSVQKMWDKVGSNMVLWHTQRSIVQAMHELLQECRSNNTLSWTFSVGGWEVKIYP